MIYREQTINKKIYYIQIIFNKDIFVEGYHQPHLLEIYHETTTNVVKKIYNQSH